MLSNLYYDIREKIYFFLTLTHYLLIKIKIFFLFSISGRSYMTSVRYYLHMCMLTIKLFQISLITNPMMLLCSGYISEKCILLFSFNCIFNLLWNILQQPMQKWTMSLRDKITKEAKMKNNDKEKQHIFRLIYACLFQNEKWLKILLLIFLY